MMDCPFLVTHDESVSEAEHGLRQEMVERIWSHPHVLAAVLERMADVKLGGWFRIERDDDDLAVTRIRITGS